MPSAGSPHRATTSLESGCLWLGSAILITLAAASCSSEPPTAPPSVLPPGTPQATLVRLDLLPPASIAPGESVQLILNAIRSDSSVDNASGRARWNSSNRNVLEISSTGLATGVARGEAFISVSYESRSVSATTFVLPAGTYRLDGTVTDSGIRLPGVSVSTVEGAGDDLTTTTNTDGKYALYGVRGRVRLQVKGAGYLDEIQEVDVANHRTVDVEMRIGGQRTDVRGRYRLTIDRNKATGSSCTNAGLPDDRSYDATVDQEGARLTVTLSGADFIVTRGRGRSFSGLIDSNDRVTFQLGEEEAYYWEDRVQDLVERISDTHSLVIAGRVTAVSSPAGMAGTLTGFFLRAEGTAGGPPFKFAPTSCFAAHRFEMTRTGDR